VAISAIRNKPLDLTKRPGRKLSSLQAYTRLFYKKKLKAVVDPKWLELIAENPALKRKRGEKLRHRNTVIREVFDVETDEVKEEVEKRRKEGIFSDDDIDDGDTVEMPGTEEQCHNKVQNTKYQK
jgi:hypothetical protein